MEKTLDRVLSKAGYGSRTEARRWILAGRVAVDGRTLRDPDAWIDIGRQRIFFDGEPLRRAEPVYLLLYKPKGYLTTYDDPAGRPTVYDLLPEGLPWVFPVGRLDLDTSGLLVLTNDTRFAEHLSSPDHQVPKTYLVKANRLLSDEDLDRLRQGLELADGKTRPAEVARLRNPGGRTVFEIVLREGKNRQVRRMVEALGAKVLKLVRVAIGEIAIGDLPIGHLRPLTAAEVRALGGRPRKAPAAPAIAPPARPGGKPAASARRPSGPSSKKAARRKPAPGGGRRAR
jgi:23S rRNA pseudouridine2605 synthase